MTQSPNINAQTIDGRTPLFELCSAIDEEVKKPISNRERIAKLLLDNGADPSLPDLKGRTPFHWSCFYGKTHFLNYMYGKYDQQFGREMTIEKLLNAHDNDGIYPIHLAALNGQKEIVAFLQNRGADLGVLDRECRTVLHYAARAENNSAFQYLKDQKMSLEALDVDGYTPEDYLSTTKTFGETQEGGRRSSDSSVFLRSGTRSGISSSSNSSFSLNK